MKTARRASAAPRKPNPPDRDTAQPEAGAERPGRLSAEGLFGSARTDLTATITLTWRQWMPHALAATVAGTGLALQAITASGAASPTETATVAAAVTIPAAVRASQLMRRRHPRWARRTLIAGLGIAAWLTTAPWGVGHDQLAVLAGLEMALAARWWQIHRIPHPPNSDDSDIAPDADEPVTELTDDDLSPFARQISLLWEEQVAVKTGPAPNSELLLPTPTRHGYEWKLKLAPGQQTYPEILNQVARIASGVDVGVTDVMIEKHREHRSPSWCRLQILENSPIEGNVDFTGPRRLDTLDGEPGYGILQLGPYADGEGEAPWRLYTPGSMWSGVVIGDSGIGKSRVTENIVISAVSRGDTEYWYIDPNRGGSSPALADHADWFATADDADDVLEAVLCIIDARAEENAVMRLTGFTPSPDRPGLLVVIDECHRIFTQDKAPEWARVAREGRKVGVSLLPASQYAGIITFGNNEPLRQSVMAGNSIAMRVTSKSGKGLMAGLEVDPLTLPELPGYGYTMRSEKLGGRTAPFRNRNTTPGGDAEAPARWLAMQPRPGLDTLTVTATLAAGTAYRDRHAVDESGRSASARRVEQLRAGHLPDDFLNGASPNDTSGHQAMPSVMAQVITFPTFTPVAAAPKAAEPAVGQPTPARQPVGLSDSQQAVWAAVAAGFDQPKEIGERVGLSPRQTQALLRQLLEDGHLTQPKYGRYRTAS
ncbi:ATP-binding protein [Actinomadura harenae]|uniref:ATP-binding protein n=1 Tax=Actinomadura harenae TaxID=2483351 RepID=A0A3M2M8J1_9ACTN|nr:ATP-binding protein [Actinomadura harenae]RMI45300.1 ATP-binding protein [Actinomadura harenae]